MAKVIKQTSDVVRPAWLGPPDMLPTEGIFAELRHGSDGIHLDLDLLVELIFNLWSYGSWVYHGVYHVY
jgi:hypothetical protein